MINETFSEKKKKTLKVLDSIHNLPTIANVMIETTKLLEDSSTSTSTLSRIIGRDQGLSTKLLAIANSPIYGIPRKVSTIDFAILVLGYQEIKNIIIGLSIMETFKNMNDGVLDYKDLWLHSFLVGSLARRIALDLGYKISGEAFIAGLLHDLAVSAIHKYFHSSFLKIIELKNSGSYKFIEAEEETLGLTHQEIGNILIEKWNLPANLCNTVMYHHNPSRTDKAVELVSIVHIADYFVGNWKFKDFFWDDDISLDDTAINTLRFRDKEHLEQFMEQYKSILETESKLIKF